MLKIESIADRARQEIKEWIITGQFRPGQQLIEGELACKLGISRPPIREALKGIEETGLVIRKANRGVFVSEITEKDAWEIYTLKAALYEMATDISINVISEQEIKELEIFIEKMQSCILTDPVDLIQYNKLHINFHKNIMSIAGNERLAKFALDLHNQISPFSYKSLAKRGHLRSSVQYHKEIVNAFKERDRDKAKRLSKEHVLKALEPLLETLRDEEGKKNNLIETELSKYKNDIRSTRSAISDSNNG